MKEIINKASLKLKASVLPSFLATVKKMRRQVTGREKTFARDRSDKGTLSKHTKSS